MMGVFMSWHAQRWFKKTWYVVYGPIIVHKDTIKLYGTPPVRPVILDKKQGRTPNAMLLAHSDAVHGMGQCCAVFDFDKNQDIMFLGNKVNFTIRCFKAMFVHDIAMLF